MEEEADWRDRRGLECEEEEKRSRRRLLLDDARLLQVIGGRRGGGLPLKTMTGSPRAMAGSVCPAAVVADTLCSALKRVGGKRTSLAWLETAVATLREKRERGRRLWWNSVCVAHALTAAAVW
jgi:hypothetical protein